MIEGGYYIKARKIQESEISHASPHVREIWDWLLMEVNHADTKVCLRGETVRSYNDILEGLSWYIGWRKMKYKRHDCENAMKYLKKRGMITIRKTTRGMVIKVENYDYYQTPSNYDSHTDNQRIATREPQSSHTINKNEKNEKNDKKKETTHTPEKIEVEKKRYGEYQNVYLTEVEFNRLGEKIGNISRDSLITELDLYLGANRQAKYKYKDHNLVIQQWFNRKVKEHVAVLKKEERTEARRDNKPKREIL